MRVKNKGDKPGTKPSFYYYREPPVLLNILSCAAPVIDKSRKVFESFSLIDSSVIGWLDLNS